MSTTEMVPMSEKLTKLRTDLEAKRETIFAAAAQHIRPERFTELVARACIRNPDLLECTRTSLFMSAAQAASLGLEIDGTLGHAYLLPFRNRGALEATLVPGYLGLKELAYRSGMIASVETGRVKQDDEFDWEKGTQQFLKHRPSDSPVNGAATHVYAIVRTTTHGTMFDVMSWAQVEAHRNKFSKGWQRKDSAWQTNPVAMAEKTVLRKVLKLCPLSSELQRLMQQEELAEHHDIFQSGEEAAPEDLDTAAELIEGAAKKTPAQYGDEHGNLSAAEQSEAFGKGPIAQSEIPF